jgi:hypothetical protein
MPQTEPIGSLGAVGPITTGQVDEPPAPPTSGPTGWIHARSSDGQRWLWISPADLESPARLTALLSRLEVTPAAAPERFPTGGQQSQQQQLRPQFPAGETGIGNVWAAILADFRTLENAQLSTRTYYLRHLIRAYGELVHFAAATHEAIMAQLTA